MLHPDRGRTTVEVTMRVGICTLVLWLPEAHSLKEKRRVVKALKDQLHHRFNVSVAETRYQDLHQHAELGVACVAIDARQANRVLSHVVQYVEHAYPAEFADYSIEIV